MILCAVAGATILTSTLKLLSVGANSIGAVGWNVTRVVKKPKNIPASEYVN